MADAYGVNSVPPGGLPARIATSTGTAYYVDATLGNDSTGTGAIGAPWQTIAKGMASVPNVAGGAILYLRAGNYIGRVNPVAAWAGTAANVKTLKAYPGEKPVLQRYIVRVDQLETGFGYWRFDGLTFDGTGAGVGEDVLYYGRAGSHIEFLNCEIKNSPLGSGMVIEDLCDDVQWWGCNIHDNGRTVPGSNLDHGLYLHCNHAVVCQCRIWNNSAYGVQLYPSNINGFVVSNTFSNNGVWADPGWGGSMVLDGTTPNATHDNLIQRNVMANSVGYAIRTYGNVQAGSNTTVKDNLIYGSTIAATFYSVPAGVTETGTVIIPLDAAFSAPTGLVQRASATAYSVTPYHPVSLPATGFRTFNSAATRFKISLHGQELVVTFPYPAATQEIEWLLDEYPGTLA